MSETWKSAGDFFVDTFHKELAMLKAQYDRAADKSTGDAYIAYKEIVHDLELLMKRYSVS